MTADGNVDIRQDGNGGLILYTEPGLELRFSWEFAMPPSIALVFGPRDWKQLGPAPADLKWAIYHRVASEVVRQRAPGGSYDLDMRTGVVDIIRAR